MLSQLDFWGFKCPKPKLFFEIWDLPDGNPLRQGMIL